ncbi:hypothetical protein [Sphingobacterium puteale]|uniref:hypothetical protein n=1 Tax=Sphingobacterium puteale TaxID=2420510 RepID=UPI001600D631|nr:hypothetical protein [Sphingobacterium puteale]
MNNKTLKHLSKFIKSDAGFSALRIELKATLVSKGDFMSVQSKKDWTDFLHFKEKPPE